MSQNNAVIAILAITVYKAPFIRDSSILLIPESFLLVEGGLFSLYNSNI
jgi:hypothetical protein